MFNKLCVNKHPKNRSYYFDYLVCKIAFNSHMYTFLLLIIERHLPVRVLISQIYFFKVKQEDTESFKNRNKLSAERSRSPTLAVSRM